MEKKTCWAFTSSGDVLFGEFHRIPSNPMKVWKPGCIGNMFWQHFFGFRGAGSRAVPWDTRNRHGVSQACRWPGVASKNCGSHAYNCHRMKSSEDDILPNFPDNNKKKYIHAYKIANYLEPSLRARHNTPIIQSHQPMAWWKTSPQWSLGHLRDLQGLSTKFTVLNLLLDKNVTQVSKDGLVGEFCWVKNGEIIEISAGRIWDA